MLKTAHGIKPRVGVCVSVCRFRLLSKSLAAFLAAQLPSNASLRLSADAAAAPGCPSTPGSPSVGSPSPVGSAGASQQAQQTLAQLESLRGNKAYASLRGEVEQAVVMVSSAEMSLHGAPAFLARLVNALYPPDAPDQLRYLDVVRRPPL